MKIGIIGQTSLSFMPYLLCYTDLLDERGIAYDLYYWNRYREAGMDKPNYHEFSHSAPGRTYDSWIGYMKYRGYVKGLLDPRRYDLVIVLGVQIAVFLSDLLSRRRYILDIRDYSFEQFPLFRKFERALLRKSVMNVISSDGFREWLPPDREYVLSHNMTLSALRRVTEPSFNTRTKSLLYIGAISRFHPTVEIFNAVANDKEISVSVVGHGLCEKKLERYCRRRAIANVFFSGRYVPQEKRRHLEKANFIMAAYGNADATVTTAVPNKLYDACLSGKPIIVSHGTYLSSLVEKYGLGIVFDPKNPGRITKDIDKYYDRAYYERYLLNCRRFLKVVEEEILLFHQKLTSCLERSQRADRSPGQDPHHEGG